MANLQNIMDKIVEGKLKAFYDQVCLLRQKYVKDNAITVDRPRCKRGTAVWDAFKNTTFCPLANRRIMVRACYQSILQVSKTS